MRETVIYLGLLRQNKIFKRMQEKYRLKRILTR